MATLTCAACVRSLPAEQFNKAQCKKGPQKMRCKTCVTTDAPLPVSAEPQPVAAAVPAPATASVAYRPPDDDHCMDVEMETGSKGPKETGLDVTSRLPQRDRTAKSRISAGGINKNQKRKGVDKGVRMVKRYV